MSADNPFIKFKTTIAYAKPDKSNHILTKDALKQLADSAKLPLMVMDNFNYASLPVGICTALKVEGDKLIADIKINPKFISFFDDDCIVDRFWLKNVFKIIKFTNHEVYDALEQVLNTIKQRIST